MDLSAVIFVALAVAWAAYLIPKALKHHDEMASDRLVEGHSEKVRVLSRKARAAAVQAADVAQTADAIILETPAEPEQAEAPTAVSSAGVRPTRAAARAAARRRRRVLGALVLVLVVVWALTWLAYLPIWAPGVPGAFVVAWLVVARLSVRKQQRRRRVAPVARPAEDRPAEDRPAEGRPAANRATAAAPALSAEAVPSTSNAEEFLDQLADEDTTGLVREELEEALASEGSLWDPLPMTLPTYVNKARARRTVRTIELTGISSSGHDDTDSSLARDAAESAHADEDSAARRKAAGA